MTAPPTAAEMALVAGFVEEVSGVVIDATKDYLVQGRLGPVVERVGASSYADLVGRARADQPGRIRRAIIDAITTSETSFFRDQWPFDLFAHKLAPDVLERQMIHGAPTRQRLDVWSAAVATGQEIYSLAMVLLELLGNPSRTALRLIGTDISEAALTVASRGVYSAAEVSRGLSERRRERFFEPDRSGWRVRDELRAMVTFLPCSLLDRTAGVGTFDVVFCRNVAIYFAAVNRRRLFDGIADRLRPSGALVVGATEALGHPRFAREEFRGAPFYRKVA
jgi:chemotaxis protein methyltransferase CheR